MGNVSMTYFPPKQWLNRAYIKGFVTQAGVTNSLLAGQHWTFDYPPALLHWDLYVSDEFFPATSNNYTVDHVIDLSQSWSYVLGVPTPTLIYFGLMYVPGEGLPRLGTGPGLDGDPAQRQDLAGVPGYWMPNTAP